MTQNDSPFLTRQTVQAPADLLEKAQQFSPPRVAIARAGAPLAMQAAKQASDAGIMIPIFTGESADITAEANALDWDISSFELIATSGEQAAALAAARACADGKADVLMKGHLHTDVFLKAALSRDIGLRTDKRLVHIFHISPPKGGRAIILSDAAVNVAPDINTRQASIKECVTLAHQLGIAHPKVAILSATETPIASVPSSIEACALRDWARQAIHAAKFSGPLALDLALSPQAVAIKGLQDDPVAGAADVIIVPDIVSGNILFKSLVYLAAGCAAGIVLGAKIPILLTSRADPAPARLASAALAAIVNGTKPCL